MCSNPLCPAKKHSYFYVNIRIIMFDLVPPSPPQLADVSSARLPMVQAIILLFCNSFFLSFFAKGNDTDNSVIC